MRNEKKFRILFMMAPVLRARKRKAKTKGSIRRSDLLADGDLMLKYYRFVKREMSKHKSKLPKAVRRGQKGGAFFGVLLGLARALVPLILRAGARSAIFFARTAMREIPKEIMQKSLELALKSAKKGAGQRSGPETADYWKLRRKKVILSQKKYMKRKMLRELAKKKKNDQHLHLQRSLRAAKRRRMVL